MGCRKFRALIDLYLDGEADHHQTQILFSHMRECVSCQRRFEEVRSLHSVIKYVPTVDLPKGFRSKVIERIQSAAIRPRRSFAFFPAISVAGAVLASLLIFAIIYYLHNPEPALAVPEIHIVSPREDAVIEQQYVDVSAAFSSGDVRNIRVILDSRDVTSDTEVNEDFLIYTSDALTSGYHMATVQITDNKGFPITQRSWAFYIIKPESG